MIYSLTGFSRQDLQTASGTLVWEISSVNHRYLEPKFRLPESMRSLENKLRTQLQQQLKRGKVDCRLIYTPNPDMALSLVVNKAMVAEVAKAVDEINAVIGADQQPNVGSLLAWPGVLQEQKQDEADLQQQALDLFAKTVTDLVAARAREGEVIQHFIDKRLTLIDVEVQKVSERLPYVIATQRERLLAALEQLRTELNSDRLEQEMIYFIQKIDVEEELSRLQGHIDEFRRLLAEGGMAGRRFDFLVQELNREANTLASKSTDKVMTLAAVEIKVLLEQIREQVQNVE